MPPRIPPTVQKQNEPTLGEVYSTAHDLYKKTEDERLEKTIKQVEERDGTMTDQDMGTDLKNIANEFSRGEIATTNMSDGAMHTEEEIIKQIKLNNEEIKAMQNPSIFRIIINWIKENLFGCKVEKVEDEIEEKKCKIRQLIEESQRVVKDGKITIDENCNLQIGSILKDKHFTAFIIDKSEKTITLIGPNGHILTENENYKNVQSKQEMLTKLFGSDVAMELINDGWKLCDANCYKGNDEDYKQQSQRIFDIVTYTDEQKNVEDVQSKNGACGVICSMFIEKYINNKLQIYQQRGRIGNNMQDFLNNLNYDCKSTEQTVAKQKLSNAIKAVKNKLM